MSKHPNFYKIVHESPVLGLKYFSREDRWELCNPDPGFTLFYCSEHDDGVIVTRANVPTCPPGLSCGKHANECDFELSYPAEPHGNCWIRAYLLEQVYNVNGERDKDPPSSLLTFLKMYPDPVHLFQMRFFMGLPGEADVNTVCASSSFWETEKFTSKNELRKWLVHQAGFGSGSGSGSGPRS